MTKVYNIFFSLSLQIQESLRKSHVQVIWGDDKYAIFIKITIITFRLNTCKLPSYRHLFILRLSTT